MEFYSGDRSIQPPSTEGFSLRRLHKRSKVRKLRLFLEGPDAWRDAPRGAGTRTFSLPNGDMLHFDYEATGCERDTAQSGEVLFDWVEAPRYVTVTLVPGAAA